MPTIRVRRDARADELPRVCVISGEMDGVDLIPVSYAMTRPVFAMLMEWRRPGSLARRSFAVALPFTKAAYEGWHRGRVLAIGLCGVAFFVLIAALGFSLWPTTASLAGQAAGTGLAVIVLAGGIVYARPGPRCVEVSEREVTFEVPSVGAAYAFAERDTRLGEAPLEKILRNLAQAANKAVPAGTRCSKHGGVAATFACAKCSATGCRDCEFRVGSPSVLVCGACLRAASN